jgi:hypothetical protein
MARVKRDAGNAGSPPAPTGAPPWTEDEQRRAEPLPLPTVPSADAPVDDGTHAGRGTVKPGGPPES